MSEPLPPKLTTEPGTPAREWAHSTTTAAFARTEPTIDSFNPDTNPAPIHPTTAGVSLSSASDANKGAFDPSYVEADVPGAYPVTPGEHDPTRQTSLQDTARAASQQTSMFMQNVAVTAAQYLPQGVVDTVSSYIPTSSATSTMSSARASENDQEHKTSLPTTELSGASNRERVGGIGSLPGPVNETGVPKLPDERHSDERYTTAAGAAAAVAGGAYVLKDRILGVVPSQEQAKQTAQQTGQSVQNTAQNAAQTVKQTVPGLHSTAVTSSTLPAHEPFGAKLGDHSLGVGALPGNQSEASVALLPDESAHPQYDSGAVSTRAQVALKPSEERTGNEAAFGAMRHVGGVGALVGDHNEKGVGQLPDERSTGTSQPNLGTGAILGTRDNQGKQGVNVLSADGQGVNTPSADKQPMNTTSLNLGTGAILGTRSEQGKQGTQVLSADKHESIKPQQSEKAPVPPAKNDGSNKAAMSASGPKGQPEKGSGYDTDYHPADLHPLKEGSTEPAHHASEGEKSLEATQTDSTSPGDEEVASHSGNGPSQKEHKATFMEKMKGEAKILIGKMEGKDEKVEEGQKMKRGEAKAMAAKSQSA